MRFTEVIDDKHSARLVDEAGKVRLRIYLDGDSIEGKRAPDADERVRLLAYLATCHNDLDNWNLDDPEEHEDPRVPIRRTWGSPSYDLGERCVCGHLRLEHRDAGITQPLGSGSCRRCPCDGFQLAEADDTTKQGRALLVEADQERYLTTTAGTVGIDPHGRPLPPLEED